MHETCNGPTDGDPRTYGRWPFPVRDRSRQHPKRFFGLTFGAGFTAVYIGMALGH